MRRLLAVAACVVLLEMLVIGQAERPLLLRHPTLSRTQIVFSFAGDLWIVPRDGGDARRLTSGVGVESDPFFSPDGTQVAFTGEYDGNEDVYVIPTVGGVPKRLTYHPGDDTVTGWTPDGKNVTFISTRASYYHGHQMFTVPSSGGFAVQLPLPIVEQASYSPDASHLAYVPHLQWQPAWKRYRGGQTTPIWIADLADSKVERVPRDNSNDFNPMWVGNTIYFLSDRNGPVSLFAYDRTTKQVAEAVKNDGLDFKSASAGPGAIVIEQFGALRLFDTATRRVKTIGVTLAAIPRGAAAVRQGGREAHSQLRHLAVGRSRGHGGMGRNLHGARRKRRRAEPDPHRRRSRARSGVVAGRPVDRVLFGRVWRIRARDPRSDRHGRGEEDRARTVILLLARVVARFDAGRVQ
jgi:tricorn protease